MSNMISLRYLFRSKLLTSMIKNKVLSSTGSSLSNHAAAFVNSSSPTSLMVGLWLVICMKYSSTALSLGIFTFEKATTMNTIHNYISPLPNLSNLPMKFWNWVYVKLFHWSGRLTLYLSLVISNEKREINRLVLMVVPASDSTEKNLNTSRMEVIVNLSVWTFSVAGRIMG